MPKDTKPRLADFPIDQLRALAEYLCDHIQPAVVRGAAQVTGETERGNLIFQAGRYSIVEDLRQAIAYKENEHGATRIATAPAVP